MSLSNVPKPPLKKIQLDDRRTGSYKSEAANNQYRSDKTKTNTSCDCNYHHLSKDRIKPSRHLIAKALASKSVCGQAFLLASVSQAIKSRNLFQADSTGQWEDPSRVPTSDWSIGVPNNVFDFGFQRTSTDMYV
ncbi:hypothetical protein HZH66_006745 [Vespula vulgaris]|uniref:Uncharacterized protein n=1 Tax=Vespula vulgaris TaxID=7454 RepID=A0A834K2B8_VESVU|nr:hypothetical protein HZH66_006745 [Vespula vulgaris]